MLESLSRVPERRGIGRRIRRSTTALKQMDIIAHFIDIRFLRGHKHVATRLIFDGGDVQDAFGNVPNQRRGHDADRGIRDHRGI